MSLSMLNAYNSSDESDEDTPDVEPSKTKDSTEQESTEQKNFFLADSSDSDVSEDEDVTAIPTEYKDGASVTYPIVGEASCSTPSVQQPLLPLYGPPHPSQLYNHATYNQGYDAASDLPVDFDHQTGPPEKRRRALTNDDAKRLIKKYECDVLNVDVPDELEIVEANVDSHLGNVRANLLKNMMKIPTAEEASAAMIEAKGGQKAKKDDNKPDGLAKRKHQITYLAYLAKANEEKLQNEWAKNRVTKRQTQAKYGF